MQRTRAWRRAQRKRVIRRRLNIIKNIWMDTPWPWLKGGAKLSKHNLTCRPRCGVCKPWKRWPVHHRAEEEDSAVWLDIGSDLGV